eukprot:CAMPEP_0176504588 /NCGR_PEP_ID=MMETSP0200_2-20121128/16021_1 /TAXON_ID=947934 /ORGANISM="Chaetoceros sp., Strain GSL56" /LENGTH=304 /DNA_ID=CAMNT_0017904045 /DNA_START=73 /DNA_END=987 /DNA_ORIENTATION=+
MTTADSYVFQEHRQHSMMSPISRTNRMTATRQLLSLSSSSSPLPFLQSYSHCPTTRTALNHHRSSLLSSSSSSCHSSTSTKSRSSSISSSNSSSSLYNSRGNNNNNNNSNSNNNNQAKPLAKATLTEDTTWRLRLSLNGVPTQKGRKVGELLYVDVKFLQEDGYEPPQGTIQQIISSNQQQQQQQQGNDAKTTYLKINRGRWQLSEDPEDRKDGLWIWGLFKEPLYPFMLLQIETQEYAIPGSSDGDAIQPLTLYAQINHRRDKNTGQVELDATPLNLREYESVKGVYICVCLCVCAWWMIIYG